jgi:hypothetical protein
MSLFDSASICITPNGVKEGKLYSIKPTDGSGDLVVTRATTATRVNSAGLIEIVPYNLATYSEQFDNASWTKQVLASVTANTTIAPNGTLTADTLTINAGSYMNQQVATSVGDVTVSIYVKVASGTKQFQFYYLQGNTTSTTFTATTEWQRFEYTFNVGTIANFYPIFVDNVGGGDYFIWGFQVNSGSVAKEYLRTETRLNIPRLDYTNGSCPSILVEPQRTNLVDVSNGASGNFFNGVVVLNAATSPQGINNAFSFNVNDGQSGGQAFVTLTTSSQSYTFSAYLKGSVNGQKVRLFGDLNGTIQDFTLTTEWVRYTKTFTGSVGAQSFYLLNGSYFSPAQNDLYYGYGMQIEVGAYATSLIPTQGSTVTRNADVISKTGISSLIGQTEGTILFEINAPNPNSPSGVTMIQLGSGASRIYIGKESSTQNIFQLATQSASGYNFINSSIITTSTIKFAIAYKNGDNAFYINGVLVSSASATANPTSFSQINFGDTDFGNTDIKVKSATLWKTRLTNDQLAQLTTI